MNSRRSDGLSHKGGIGTGLDLALALREVVDEDFIIGSERHNAISRVDEASVVASKNGVEGHIEARRIGL